MNKDQREIQRKLRILRYAEEIGHVAKACRYLNERFRLGFRLLEATRYTAMHAKLQKN